MSLVQDVETAVGKSDGLAQHAPALDLVQEAVEVIYFLRNDLR